MSEPKKRGKKAAPPPPPPPAEVYYANVWTKVSQTVETLLGEFLDEKAAKHADPESEAFFPLSGPAWMEWFQERVGGSFADDDQAIYRFHMQLTAFEHCAEIDRVRSHMALIMETAVPDAKMSPFPIIDVPTTEELSSLALTWSDFAFHFVIDGYTPDDGEDPDARDILFLTRLYRGHMISLSAAVNATAVRPRLKEIAAQENEIPAVPTVKVPGTLRTLH